MWRQVQFDKARAVYGGLDGYRARSVIKEFRSGAIRV